MAKKSGRKKGQKETNPKEQTGARGQRSTVYMALIGVALAAWIVWRLQPTQGIETALLWGAVAGLAWAVFIVGSYILQRRGNQEDE